MSDDTLFDPGTPAYEKKPSKGAARTARQKVMIAGGMHPVTRRRLAGNGMTCGTCVHRVAHRWSQKRINKCDLADTRSEATDIRVSWPACELWETERKLASDRCECGDVRRSHSLMDGHPCLACDCKRFKKDDEA